MTTVTIPSTIEGATQRLGAVGKLLTAMRWERAAIVWAFTHLHEDSGKPAEAEDIDTNINKTLSTVKFADLDIHGLTHHATVRHYHQRWQEAIDSGHAKPAEPGKEIQLPDVAWEQWRDRKGRESYAKSDLVQGLKHLDVKDIVEVMTDSFAARAKIEGPSVISDLLGSLHASLRPLLPGPEDVIPRERLGIYPRFIADVRKMIEMVQQERPDEYVDLLISVCEALISVLNGNFDADLVALLEEGAA